MSLRTIYKNSSPRVRALYLFLIIMSVIYGARLWDLQVLRSEYYNNVAIAEHEKKFEIAPQRGEIYIKDNGEEVPLVLNETLHTVFADPRFIEDPSDAAKQIADTLGGDKEYYEDLLKQEDKAYVILAKRVHPDQADLLKEKELAGVGIQNQSYRVYPETTLGSQLLGFVNDEGLGQYGIEAYLNEQLTGDKGLLKAVTDVKGVPLPTNDDNIVKDAVDGEDLVLTIDRNVQQFAEDTVKKHVEETRAVSGSAIVMDPNTGAIMAMANFPTYNPADYREVEDYQVFQNDVVSDPYEAGSVIKPFTMALGLETGAVTRDTEYFDARKIEVDTETIENAEIVGGGFTRNMFDVIRYSVNTGTVFVLEQLGGGEINQQGRGILYDGFVNKFGFGKTTGVAQSGEGTGYITPPDDPAGVNIRYANMSFGQGMTTTMMQVATAFSSIVNGGDYYQPYLVEKYIKDDGTESLTQPNLLRGDLISDSVSQDLKDMMIAIVDGSVSFNAKRPGYKVGGKTGTAEIPDPTGGYFEGRANGSFVGFGGGDKVEYVVMTRINEPKISGYAGGGAAGPMFADISNFLIDYLQIPPVN